MLPKHAKALPQNSGLQFLFFWQSAHGLIRHRLVPESRRFCRSHLSFAIWAPPTFVYPCGSEVFRLGSVLFARIQDSPEPYTEIESPTASAPITNDGQPHSLGTLSLLSFEDLLDFYLTDMDIADRLAATRAFGAGQEWTWGELPKASQVLA